MANPVISGTGPNSRTNLQNIHSGQRSFQKDLATVHSQVKLMQTALTLKGYNTQGADGKFGDNTLAAVNAFQRANGLVVDGYFGKSSLTKLEQLIGGHLDPTPGGCSGDGGGSSPLMSINEYINNLESFCNCGWKYGPGCNYSTKTIDCAWYPYQARNGQGAHGCTTEYNDHLSSKGRIVGGYSTLQRGMEIFQDDPDPTKKGHMGVYAGLVNIAGTVQHAVYQSCSSHINIPAKYNHGVPGDSGPNLTGMNDNWKYWGWSKYVANS